MKTIRLTTWLGSKHAMTAMQGTQFARELERHLSQGRPVCVDLTGIRSLTSGFLNCSVGSYALRDRAKGNVSELVSFTGMPDGEMGVIWREKIDFVMGTNKQTA